MSPLRVGVITDSYRRRPTTGSSTLALIASGIERGHRLFVLDPSALCVSTYESTSSTAFPVRRPPNDWDFCLAGFSSPERQVLADFDVLLMRQQPPIDAQYVSLCVQLSSVPGPVLWVNSPRSILQNAEKLWPIRFPDIHPPTLVTSSVEELENFQRQHGDVVLKPLFDFQGNGVIRVGQVCTNLRTVLRQYSFAHAGPIVMQKFLPDVKRGDKRIFVVDGSAVGCFLRIPPEDGFIANLHAGGTACAARLDERDWEICRTLAPALSDANLPFVALDVVGGYLTEIGTTSPTGLVQIQKLTGISVATALWEWIEGRVEIREQS